MIKYIQETRDDKPTLKINYITMVYWYHDAAFAVHTYMKIHTGGVLNMGKGENQKIQRSRISVQKVLHKENWQQ